MKNSFKFIHAADIHLGSFLSINGNINDELKELRSTAVYKAFEKICLSAIKYNVDFILISGDLYDIEFPSVKANKFFAQQCSKLNDKEIDIYLIHGNHDALNERKELFDLPPNTHILSSDDVDNYKVIKNNEVIANIIGQSYKYKSMSSDIVSKYEIENNDTFNIAMLHTSLQPSKNNYVPCSKQDLINNEYIDYWALGHVHKREIINYEKPFIAFSGIPQERDMGEEGVGGAFLVEVSGKDILDTKFIPTSIVSYKKIEVSIDDNTENKVKNISDLEEIILNMSSEIVNKNESINENICLTEEMNSEGYIVQWVIEGKTKIHNYLSNMSQEDMEALINSINMSTQSLNPFLWTDSIVIRTQDNLPLLDDLIHKNKTFMEMKNVINEMMKDEKVKNELIKNWGYIWAGKENADRINYEKFHISDDIYENIIKQAENLVIEKLMENMKE